MRKLRIALEPLTVRAGGNDDNASAASRVAVVIPALNEEAAIGPVISAIPRTVADRIIVADGGSSDATVECAARTGAEVVQAGRGYGRACAAGVEAADDVDIVVFMDGDGADDPSLLAGMVGPIRAGAYDFVIGSRVRGVREPGSMAWHQIAAGRFAGLAIHALYGVRYTDMCAFRAIRRDALMRLGMGEMTYGWNVEMQMRAARAGLRILEVPVPCRRRLGGASKVAGNLAGSLRAGTRILATIARIAAQPRSHETFPMRERDA
jgi:glycosyltransferase involved in cell wall biosynthesis